MSQTNWKIGGTTKKNKQTDRVRKRARRKYMGIEKAAENPNEYAQKATKNTHQKEGTG